MDLKNGLAGFTESVETEYVALGVGLLAVLLLAMQLQPSVKGGEQISISLKVDFGERVETRSLTLSNNTTAFEAVNGSFDVEYREYDMGYFITSIGNVSMDSNHSWLYFVNSEPAKRAVNRYLLEDNDNLTFRYLENSKASKYFD
ncbi:MAG: DUF4430 domain-containing protein [Candidatus Nanohaloarchaea archaeon]